MKPNVLVLQWCLFYFIFFTNHSYDVLEIRRRREIFSSFRLITSLWCTRINKGSEPEHTHIGNFVSNAFRSQTRATVVCPDLLARASRLERDTCTGRRKTAVVNPTRAVSACELCCRPLTPSGV